MQPNGAAGTHAEVHDADEYVDEVSDVRGRGAGAGGRPPGRGAAHVAVLAAVAHPGRYADRPGRPQPGALAGEGAVVLWCSVLPGKLPCGPQCGQRASASGGAVRKRPAVRRSSNALYLRTAVYRTGQNDCAVDSRPAVCAQSLVSPAAGVLGDRCNRMHLIVAGTACWAAFTLLFGFARHYAEVRLLSTVRCSSLPVLRLPARKGALPRALVEGRRQAEHLLGKYVATVSGQLPRHCLKVCLITFSHEGLGAH